MECLKERGFGNQHHVNKVRKVDGTTNKIKFRYADDLLKTSSPALSIRRVK